MARRRLSATIIEDGRLSEWAYKADRLTKVNRLNARRCLYRLMSSEMEEMTEQIPERKVPFGGKHGDKLAPLLRFLSASVGSVWSTVEAKLREKHCRGGALKRWHFMRHVNFFVLSCKDPFSEYAAFIVDEDGILRRGYEARKYVSDPLRDPVFKWNRIHKQQGFDRRVLEKGGKLFWVVPERCFPMKQEPAEVDEKQQADHTWPVETLAAIPKASASRKMVTRWRVADPLSEFEGKLFAALSIGARSKLGVVSLKTAKPILDV